MKKLLGIVALCAVILTVVACGGESEAESADEIVTQGEQLQEQELTEYEEEYEEIAYEETEYEIEPELDEIIEITLTPSGNTPNNNTVAIAFSQEDDIVFYNVPDIIYTTLGSENGLGGTFMYFRGIVQSFETVGGFENAIIQTDIGEIVLFLPIEIFDFAVEGGLMYSPTDLDLLEVGEEFGFFFMYEGFSEVLDMPAGIFVGLYGTAPAPDPEPEPEPEPTPAPTPQGISRATYNLIQNGMTRDEVQEIIGVTHTSESTTTIAGTTTTMVMWTTANFMTSITVFFTNGLVTSTIFTQL